MNTITQAELARWLDSLAQERTLIAPRQVEGVLLYRPVESSAEVAWGFSRPVLSVKEALFPPTERLLTIEKAGQQVNLTETFFEGQQVLFGVRSCDARGVQVLDAAFLEDEPVDPYYARRRERTLLVGLACREPGPSCFCTRLGGRPDDPTDMDVMLYEIDGGYAVEAISTRGRDLLSASGLPVRIPQSSISNPPSSFLNYPSLDWPSHFNDRYWSRAAERCLSCRICAYVCPTCRCFDLRDEALAGQGEFERIRCWDSCAGENYRRIAGGHQPRPEKSERLRNRILCKFLYYPQQYGLGAGVACTGCGRCVDACPVSVDITEVLEHFDKESL